MLAFDKVSLDPFKPQALADPELKSKYTSSSQYL